MFNDTYGIISEFILLGFPGFQDKESKSTMSAIFFSVYVLIIIENLFIIFIIWSDESLYKPMYFFVCNLALTDTLLATVIIPNMLGNFLFNLNRITFVACFSQALVYLYITTLEMHILAVMSYDRVIAICYPLQYASIMTNPFMTKLVAMLWIIAWTLPLVVILFALKLPFCGPNRIANCYCDHGSIIKMACTDITFNSILGLTIGLFLTLLHTAVFVFSYGKILSSVLKIKTEDGHRKALSTCGAHLCIVIITLFSSAFVYISSRLPWFSVDARLIFAMIKNLIGPVMNPFIYSLMIRMIRESIKKRFRNSLIQPLFR